MKLNKTISLGIVIMCSLVLFGCGKKNEDVFFEDDSNDSFFENVDEQADQKIEISQEYGLNEEFEVEYKTYEPDGVGKLSFKAKSIKEIDMAGESEASEGKKLVLVEIAVKGNEDNEGKPTTFNQVGDYPSPQFVLIDKKASKSYVEETYYSDSYTLNEKLFELSKITVDNQQWVNTAIVFEVDSDTIVDLAFRFTNASGEIEFYEIRDTE